MKEIEDALNDPNADVYVIKIKKTPPINFFAYKKFWLFAIAFSITQAIITVVAHKSFSEEIIKVESKNSIPLHVVTSTKEPILMYGLTPSIKKNIFDQLKKGKCYKVGLRGKNTLHVEVTRSMESQIEVPCSQMKKAP